MQSVHNSMALEVLHFTFVLLGLFAALESAKIAPSSVLKIFLSRVEPVITGFQFPDHLVSFVACARCLPGRTLQPVFRLVRTALRAAVLRSAALRFWRWSLPAWKGFSGRQLVCLRASGLIGRVATAFEPAVSWATLVPSGNLWPLVGASSTGLYLP